MNNNIADRLGLCLMLDAHKAIEEQTGQELLMDMYYDMGLKDDPENGAAALFTVGAWPVKHMMAHREDYD